MESRTVVQNKLWIITMNRMTERTEYREVAIVGYDKQKLIDFVSEQMISGGYRDGGENNDRWFKSFKKDGPLEWFNPCDILNGINHYGHGMHFEWVNEDIVIDPSVHIVR